MKIPSQALVRIHLAGLRSAAFCHAHTSGQRLHGSLENEFAGKIEPRTSEITRVQPVLIQLLRLHSTGHPLVRPDRAPAGAGPTSVDPVESSINKPMKSMSNSTGGVDEF